MFGGSKTKKKTTTKPAPKQPTTKASEVTYDVTCDAKGNIKSIVPTKKKKKK